MRAMLVALAGATFVAHATPAMGQVQHHLLDALGDHVPIEGVSGRQPFTYDFRLDSFAAKDGRLFAVGMLSGGNLPAPRAVAIPVAGSVRGESDDANGSGGFGGFGALHRDSPARPAVLRGSAAPPSFQQALLGASSPTVVLKAQATQTCPVLNLVLQSTHLNLLGLVVDLQAVILDITAVAGAGNLLGNLLCSLVSIVNP